MDKVLDSWALLAWIQAQPAAPQVRALLEQAERNVVSVWMSWINIGEVFYLLARRRGLDAAEQFLARVPSLPLRTVMPEQADVVQAARLKGTRRISYADAFGVALAARRKAPLVTGDPEMLALRDVVELEWIGE